MSNSRRKVCAAAMAALAISLTAICAINSSRWIGGSFPGFFVMANRVIASVRLSHWPLSGDIFQHAVVAVDGTPVMNSREIYSRVAQAPAGQRFTYTLEQDGNSERVSAASIVFTPRDFLLIFIPYLISGLGLALIGIAVWYSKPESPASLALLLGGIAGGIFAITASDLYSPYWFFRIHILGEAFFPASLLVHLALVFPVDRVRRYRRLILSMPYAVAAVLGITYEVFLYRPGAYTLIHNLCMDYTGLGGAALFAAVAYDFFTTQSQLIRQRIRVLFLGFLCGFAFPGILMFYSGITGGQVAVNYAGFTVVLFPLSIGYAIVKHDLFEIDALVKRSVYYIAITATITGAYLLFLATTDWTLQYAPFARSPLFPLAFTLLAVLLINPLKDALQQTVDRIFFRLRYNPKQMLEATSAALASTLQVDEIVSFIWNTIRTTMGVSMGSVYLLSADRNEYEPAFAMTGRTALQSGHPLVRRVADARGRILSPYDFDDVGAPQSRDDYDALGSMKSLDAELILPLSLKTNLVGFVTLGKKESGAFFSADDARFLRALANQSALSIANALAYREIQSLNAVLEQRVEQRTAQLSRSNSDLQNSLRELERTYLELRRSQEDLSRAEKMATLGRLAAGIAHEMNTPIGASMTSLKLLNDLVEEYKASADDKQVSPGDHREIALEMGTLVRSTRDWLEKAAGYIRSLKLHTRALHTADDQSISLPRLVDDVALLLSHSMRLSQSKLTVTCSSAGPTIQGDPGKLGQVLTNLISNAIDANRQSTKQNPQIAVDIADEGDDIVIRIKDDGLGIDPEALPHIFDEFFSTKSLGEGTGLGLPIARDIVMNFFKGSITVESTRDGSLFIVRLPRLPDRHPQPSAAA